MSECATTSSPASSSCHMRLKQLTAGAAALLLLFLLPAAAFSDAQQLQTSHNVFGPFDQSYYSKFAVLQPATISNDALQITPDSAGNFTLNNRSGRIFYNHSFTLWEDSSSNSSDSAANGSHVASFNSSFLINIFRPNSSAIPGEGLAFLIAPDMTLPVASHGQYLGLTNATTDGDPNNHLLAVELDTFKQSFDPDDNHMGININSIRSNKTVSLSDLGIQISPSDTRFYMVWIEYGGDSHRLDVYMAEQQKDQQTNGFVIEPRPTSPILTKNNINLKDIVKQQSYFGFAASTGTAIELNCVLKWNLTVELLPGGKGADGKTGLKIGLGVGVGVPAAALMLLGLGGLGYYLYKRRKAAASDENILGALKSLPGTPREFSFKELKKATNNFDERHKLGQGGYGVVYRGVLPKENLEVAVKKFSRDNLQGKDDFLAELTIINRLRHKHLVRLLGWCHKNGMLLIVYEFMPNGSLDNHLFGETETATLGWSQRYKIVTGVASALHYLHNEYDQRVVHRDLKASNIMLDSNFNSRLGDFGLARALDNEKTSYAELEGVPGTMGYIAPECFHTGKATCESDIYGFGAVILEVVCGQRPWTKMGGFQFVVDWVWSLHREGRVLDAVDQRLGNDYVAGEGERLLLLGLACMHPIAGERPKTQTIIQIISGSVPVPRVPPFKPAFVWPSSNMHEGVSSTANTVNTTSSWPLEISVSDTSEWTPPYDSQDSNGGTRRHSDSFSLL
ncbi:L-type lectin-domain containing receptor kinase S.5 [Pyrus ussuriensis x Pyrus communis]|uniref:non-specific serine/threonine protein kinase n=1 Tax=Pyrus ussuriensis x Pyrus communis TaxID=2448454 RepID=A0A5N5I211_9ROSA|nr:L-type lectin-domain containing receptor kinase S.5 [Pyrus ussuriensis x Pyrus communis]